VLLVYEIMLHAMLTPQLTSTKNQQHLPL